MNNKNYDWNPMDSSLGSYAKGQVGTGPKIDWNPLDSTPGQAVVKTGSAIKNASQGNFGQAGSDIMGAGGDLVKTGLGAAGAAFLPGVAIGLGQNESNRNAQPDLDRQEQARATEYKQQVGQQQQAQADQEQQQANQLAANQQGNQQAFNQSNSMEDALRNAWQMRRRSGQSSY